MCNWDWGTSSWPYAGQTCTTAACRHTGAKLRTGGAAVRSVDRRTIPTCARQPRRIVVVQLARVALPKGQATAWRGR
jgi:hypothetical protein